MARLTRWLAAKFCEKNPSMNIVEIAKAVSLDARHDIIGIRPGEKLHEQMIGLEDADFTFEYDGHYRILLNIHGWARDRIELVMA